MILWKSTNEFVVFRRIVYLIEDPQGSNQYRFQWDHHYKDIKGSPTVKFQPDVIEFILKVSLYAFLSRSNLLFNWNRKQILLEWQEKIV